MSRRTERGERTDKGRAFGSAPLENHIELSHAMSPVGARFPHATPCWTSYIRWVRRLIGTSAGAITATLLSVGYTPAEMLDAVNEKQNGKPRFSTFMDHPRPSDFSRAQRDASDTMRALKLLHVPMFAGGPLLDLLLETPLYPTLFSVVECGGVFAGTAFVDWLTEKLAANGVAATDTLAAVFEKKKVDLSVSTTGAFLSPSRARLPVGNGPG